MTLWDKGHHLDEEIQRFTVGEDFQIDLGLVPYDCAASIAHARVLEKAGVLTPDETQRLVEALRDEQSAARRGDFVIRREEEDCHTALENRLVSRLGDLGKKIHTARSRNDQVLAALRLYMKDRLEAVGRLMDGLVATMTDRVRKEGDVRLPGFTHMRRAMPCSLSMWMGSFVESMEDNKIMLGAARSLIDQSPLGSGAGYGIPVFDLDRELGAKEMGFARVQRNPLYVQNSRGKFEASVVCALANVMADLNKLASDLILFSMDELGFFSLPNELCTGSSIMPQKLNPDVLEVMRARYHEVAAHELRIRSTTANLVSGYNRDHQLTKKPLMDSFAIVESSLRVATKVVDKLIVNRETCERACTNEIFATQRAYALVKAGMPFRDAYRKVASELFPDDSED